MDSQNPLHCTAGDLVPEVGEGSTDPGVLDRSPRIPYSAVRNVLRVRAARMAVSSVTSKGQITIPKRVRDRLRLRPGDKVDFRIEDDGSVRFYPISRKVADVFGAFANKAKRAKSIEEMNRDVSRALAKKTS